MRRHLGWVVLATSVAVYAGCEAGGTSVFNSASDDDNGAAGGGDGAMGGSPDTFDPNTTSTSSGENTTCDATDDEDRDGDGITKAQGDCNDCDANVNPNAVEVVLDMYGQGGGGGGMSEPADENCDGQIDEPPEVCDSALAIGTSDAFDAARAIGLCKMAATPTDSGVVDAQWVSVDGSPAPVGPNYDLGHGMVDAFGPNVNPQEGGKILALSSGTARQPSDVGYQSVGGFDKGLTMNHPQGFPKESPSCPGTTTGQPHDGAAVELTIRTPSTAQGFSFNFNFYTYEWPGFVCSTFNDFFVAILDPIPMGQTDGNISFDQLGNPVSVNNAFLEVCGCSGGPPCSAGGKSFTCALGNAELAGTGFGTPEEFQDHGATSWLVTQAPVLPNTIIKIRWGVYDSGDGVLDSTTLIDKWEWVAEPGTVVGTEPVPDPQ